jgi:hypothetical protein
MNTLKRTHASVLQMRRGLYAASESPWNYSSLAVSRSVIVAKRRRERILACLALIMLVVAWDATLRLDEQVSPPRMRVSHAVEIEGEMQALTAVP